MFERFTDRGRLVAVVAQDEARRIDHDHTGTEHILLALVQAEVGGLAARLIRSVTESLTPGPRLVTVP